MYEKLVKRLRDKACRFNYDGWVDTAVLLEEAADAIEVLKLSVECWQDARNIEYHLRLLAEARVPRWISVEEQLPAKDGWYQVYAPGYSGGSSSGLKNIKGNMYSAFKNGKWSIETGYHKRPGCVKAWQPLPEPPKEEHDG